VPLVRIDVNQGRTPEQLHALSRGIHGAIVAACGIPGIAISGFGTAKDREEYRQAGFAESLVKPVDVQDVINAIGRVTAAAV